MDRDFSCKNTGVGCHFLLQGIFPTQGSSCISYLGRWILYHWATREAHTLDMTQQKKNVTSVIFLCKSYNPCLIIGETETNYNWGAFDRIDLIRRADSFEKTLMLGKTEGRRRRGRQRMTWLDGITDSMDMGLGTPGVGDGQGGLACCSSWGRRELDTTEQLNWAELNWTELFTVVQVIKNNGSLGDYHRRHDRYRQCVILDGILEPKMNVR